MKSLVFFTFLFLWSLLSYLIFNGIEFIAIEGRVERFFVLTTIISIFVGGVITFLITQLAPDLKYSNSVRIVELKDNEGNLSYKIIKYCGYFGIVTSWDYYDGGTRDSIIFKDIDRAKYTLEKIRTDRVVKSKKKKVTTRELNL
jgi:hypothetical protein